MLVNRLCNEGFINIEVDNFKELLILKWFKDNKIYIRSLNFSKIIVIF